MGYSIVSFVLCILSTISVTCLTKFLEVVYNHHVPIFFHLLQLGAIPFTLPCHLFCLSEQFLVLGWSCLWGLIVVCLPSLPLVVSMLLTFFWKWLVLCSHHFSHVGSHSPCKSLIGGMLLNHFLTCLFIMWHSFTSSIQIPNILLIAEWWKARRLLEHLQSL